MKVHNLKVTGSLTSGNVDISNISSSVTTTVTNLSSSIVTSMNLMSSSIVGRMATTGSNTFVGTQTLSGSILPAVNNTYDLGSPTQQFRHVYISSGSLYVNGTKVLGATSQELQITTDAGQSFKILEAGSDTITLQSADGNITLAASGGGDVILDPTTGIIALKGSTQVYAGNRILSSDGNAIHFGNGVTISGSLLATGTNIISGSQQISDFGYTTTSSVNTISSSINTRINSISNIQATTGSNNFVGTQTITGSLYISQNLIVQGSSSLQDVTGSNVYIGTNKVNLNTNTPSVRFGGLSVFDSGSNFGESGSLLWDSQNNRWVYQHPASSGAPYKSAIIIAGPQNSGSLGSETTLTSGKISKSVGDDHIGDSIMTETGGGIGISGSLSITGSIVATGTSLWSGSGQLPSGIVSGSSQILNGTATYLPIWNTGGATLGSSKISQPDSNNLIISHGDSYALGGKFTYNSTYVSSLTLGRTGTGMSSNATFIYDIANTEVFEIRRNYSANTFKVTLNDGSSIIDHFTIGSTGAATFNNTITSSDNITVTNAARPYFIAKTTNSGEEAGIKIQQSSVSDWYIGTAQATPSAQDLGIRDVKNNRVPLYFSSSTGAAILNNVGIGCIPQAILDVSHTAGTTNIIRVSNGAGNYRWRVDQNFSMIMTNASGTDTFSVTTSGSISTPAQFTSFATAPLSFQSNGNTGTYTQTTIYANQNNTSGDIANGIFIERGYTDTSNTEIRQFVIGVRGGSYQWKLSGPGATFQRDTCEVKRSGDGDLFIGRYSGGSAKVVYAYQSSADGYLELRTGADTIVTKLSGYSGTANYTSALFGFGKTTGISYYIDAYSGGGQVARFATNQSGSGIGQCAEFINSSSSGYASWIYIGSAPGTDWKIGKNISNSANTTYHFEIVDSSNNLRMQINNGTGNVTFSGSVTQNSDIKLKKNVRNIEGALNTILQTRGVIYDKIDESENNQIGFIAQELESVLPELVVTSDLDVKSVKYQNMTPLLVEAIRELKLENDSLKDILRRNNLI